MKAPTRFLLLLISLVSIAAMACGGSGGSASGGIGGSGFQANSVGSVSAVGSITVNGVRYQTTTATVTDDDDLSFPEGSLAEGMVVEVDGRINADGVNGTAAQVTVITAVQGPVDQVDAATNTLVIMGQPIAIDDQTRFDIDTLPNGLSDISANEVEVLEVHGSVDPNQIIRATRIEDKTGGVPTPLFKVRGFATAGTGQRFTINNLTIDFSTTPAASNDFGVNGPADGDFVSVKGASLNAGVLSADSVEDGDRGFGDNENAEIEGFIDSADVSTFTLVTGGGTFIFRVDAATEYEGGGFDDLAIGLKIEVNGTFSGGILLADKIEVKDGIRIAGTTDTVNLDAKTVTLRRLATVTLILNDQTEITDDRSGTEPTVDQLLPTLSQGGQTLRVRARFQRESTTNLIVTDLRVRDLEGAVDDAELRAPLLSAAATDGSLQLIGVAVAAPLGTTFLDIADQTIERQVFVSQAIAGTLVEADGVMTGDNMMTASQLAIED